MSHTPGPWKWDGRQVTDTTGAVVAIEGIAQPHGYNPPDDPAWDNARLIAAAPDLLAALEESAKEFRECELDTKGTPTEVYFRGLARRLEDLIAKAKGGVA